MSVIESPSATTEPTTRGSACTSIPSTSIQHGVSAYPSAVGAAARSPAARWLPWAVNGWLVTGPVGSGTYTLTSRVLSAATRSGTGSLSARPPAATVTSWLPPKVSSRIEPGTAVAPSCCTATEARPTVSARVPNVLVIRTRTARPPALTKATLRTVWSASPSPAGQSDQGMVLPSTGLGAQAATQVAGCRSGPAGLVEAVSPVVAANADVTVTARTATPARAAAPADRVRRRARAAGPV
ncbi:hypothetical protein ACN27J_02895 [Solwaraspora sp. WMMB762]|uniref:hypothetical protein n=1 Tax=Solwaraspora sp. WMMB762 TaxID=3404120 RepID=UPI003B964BCA